jgi:hypothetical protein
MRLFFRTSELASGSMACGAAAETMAKNRAMPLASTPPYFSARPLLERVRWPGMRRLQVGLQHAPPVRFECIVFTTVMIFYGHDLDEAARADEETTAKNRARCYFPIADPKNLRIFFQGDFGLPSRTPFFLFSNAFRTKSVISAPPQNFLFFLVP